MEDQIFRSEDALRALIDRLNKMNLGDSVSRWLEGDSEDSFFEFKFHRTPELEAAFEDVEVVASKAYHASGVVTVTIVFDYTAYVLVLDGANENPLLDSRFPDVSSKGRGYQLQAFAEGIEAWPELRKISVWQTVDALEQEFRERAAQVAQAKCSLGADAAEAYRVISVLGDDLDEFDRPDSKEGGGSAASAPASAGTHQDTPAALGRKQAAAAPTGALSPSADSKDEAGPAEQRRPSAKGGSGQGHEGEGKGEGEGEDGPSSAGTTVCCTCAVHVCMCLCMCLSLCLCVWCGVVWCVMFSICALIVLSLFLYLSLSVYVYVYVRHTAAAKSSAPEGGGGGGGLVGSPSGARLMPVSRGHHLPKMDNSLAKKMDELKRTMGPEVLFCCFLSYCYCWNFGLAVRPFGFPLMVSTNALLLKLFLSFFFYFLGLEAKLGQRREASGRPR
jgi:hypothetical protein